MKKILGAVYQTMPSIVRVVTTQMLLGILLHYLCSQLLLVLLAEADTLRLKSH